MSERPVPEGWESRERLVPISAPSFVAEGIVADACERIANKTDGLDSASPIAACQRAYEDFCYAYDRLRWRPVAGDDLSSCIIFLFAFLDCFGCEMPATDTAYEPRMGRAVTELVALGRDMTAWLRSVGREDAWHDTTRRGAPLPERPWMGLVGDNGAEGAEHGFVGLTAPDENGRFDVIEGGQASLFGRGFRISRAQYELERRANGQIWARRLSPNPNKWRRLRGWLDIGALPLTQRCVLPVET